MLYSAPDGYIVYVGTIDKESVKSVTEQNLPSERKNVEQAEEPEGDARETKNSAASTQKTDRDAPDRPETSTEEGTSTHSLPKD